MALTAYLIVFAFTMVFVGMVVYTYRRTRDVTIPVGAFLVYFWTFLGAWPFILDATTGYRGFHIGLAYYYLMEKMFPFELDGDYLLAVVLLGCFLLGLGVAWLVLLRPAGPLREAAGTPYRLDHRRLIVGGLFFLAGSAALVVPEITRGMHNNVSLYTAVAETPGLRGALHGLLDQMAAVCLVLGYAMRLSEGAPSPLFVSGGGRSVDRLYPVCLLLTGAYFALIGDRHPLFVGMVVGCLLLVQLYGRRAWRSALPLVAICVGSILLAGWVRSFTWNEVATLEKFETPHPDPFPYDLPLIAHVPAKKGAVADVLEPLWTNELFAAHFSMYGVLREKVPMAPGISFNYLIHAFIPSFLAERPTTVYDHYAREAHLTPGQGYTIHQATAWYLNLGWPGPFVGGFVLGLLWTGSRRLIRTGRSQAPWTAALRLIPFLFVAFLPQLLRSGPEAYKALLVEGLGVPLLLVLLAGAGLQGSTQAHSHVA